MKNQAGFALRGRNPDVLTCIANLSNDEVFTPPEFAQRMLDTLADAWAASNDGANIWEDPLVTFLDPCTKSGVFLREITSRLTRGLAEKIPDLGERVDHILTKQVFGIAITQLTSLLARRSVYCSKHAKGDHSIVRTFSNDAGNIWFERTEHTWNKAGKCTFCGASQSTLDRGENRESYAYAFIHTKDIKARVAELFGDKMHFDVIIGNPPYQLSDGGFKASASPLYHEFVTRAKELSPQKIVMVIPSRWFGGGKGLDEFRSAMINDRRIRNLVDYQDARDVFPGVDIAGGICYFLWDKDFSGDCTVVNIHSGQSQTSVRPLNEFKVFIRNGRSIPIIGKVIAKGEPKMDQQVTSRKPFGLDTAARPKRSGDLVLRWLNGEGPFNRTDVLAGQAMIEKWKVITSYAGFDHAGQPDKDGRRRVLSKIDILPPNTICTETYIVTGVYETRQEAENLVAYMKTQFFRFLVSQFMYSHHLTKSAYAFVPILDMSKPWTDAELYTRYGLDEEDARFIASVIRPM